MDYSKYTTKVLRGLLEVTNADGAAKIRAELAKRAAEQDDTFAAIQQPKKKSDAELKEIAEKVSININHRCQFVPKDENEWIDGVICSVQYSTTTQDVFYSILADNGSRYTKNINSEYIKISEEYVEVVPVYKLKSDKLESEDWSKDKSFNEYSYLIGKLIDNIITPNGESHTGRIVDIVPKKQTHKVEAKIRVYQFFGDSMNPKQVKVSRTINDTFLNQRIYSDGESRNIRDIYMQRKHERENRALPNPLQRIALCQRAVENARLNVKKANEILDAKLRTLAEAENEYKQSELRK